MSVSLCAFLSVGVLLCLECSFVFKPTFGESALGTTSLFSTREVKESDQTRAHRCNRGKRDFDLNEPVPVLASLALQNCHAYVQYIVSGSIVVFFE